MSISYIGVLLDTGGLRTLANKVSCASMEQAQGFWSHAESVVDDFYAVKAVKRRIFNSNGGTWLHRNKAVRTYVNDPDLQETILGWLRGWTASGGRNAVIP